MKRTAVSLFSGCGGMDLGFKQAGFDIIWANDIMKDAVKTYKKNIGKNIVLGDIAEIPSSAIPDDPDVLLGGFPCQGFSIANSKKKPDDERNYLYKEMVRVVRDKKPKFFVAENVKGMLSIHDGEFIRRIVSDFKQLGYRTDYKLLNMINYGVPQKRDRVIIMGNRIGAENIFPKETHGHKNGLKRPATTRETIGHLCRVPISEKPMMLNGKKILNHIAKTKIDDEFYGRKYYVDQFEVCDYLKYWRDKRGYTTKKIDDLFGTKYTAGHWFRKDNDSGSIPNVNDWWKLKKILRFDSKFDRRATTYELKKITYETSLRVNNWDEPNDTIIATGSEIHPKAKRRLSVRECAIIQTFPDDFEFVGKTDSMHTQVGNAVPVLFARKLARCIVQGLEMSMVAVPIELEKLESTYLDEFYYFLKFAKRRILAGFDTQKKIRDDWKDHWSPNQEGKGISSFAIGAERIVYAFFNSQGFGQPNSAPVGSDLFFETDDAFIHIDMKTVQTRNIGDFTTSIFVGENQNSYKETIVVAGGSRNRKYEGVLPAEYKNSGNPKPCLTYFITILYEEKSLDILCINLLCMPNGSLSGQYRSRVLKAGKNPGKTRFNFKEVSEFELLDDTPKRIRVAYFDESMKSEYKKKLSFIEGIYNQQK